MATQIKDISVQAAAANDMQAALDAQRKSFHAELPVTAEVRIDRLDRAIDLILANKDKLAEAVDADFAGRPQPMTQLTDIMGAVAPLKHAKKNLRKWMKREKRPIEFPMNLMGARGWIEYQPKGVVGVISPWNFPINLAFSPISGAFAAGNRVMLKPSEFTPATSELMAELIHKAYDPTEAIVFTGGPDVGQAFSALAFDHLIFTGATSIAYHVMRAAAANLVPLTLELGGKSPTIIGKGADLDKAASRIAMGKMMNAGQICLAPDYVFAPEGQADEFVERVAEKVAEMYPTIANNENYTAVINTRHESRLKGYVDDAKAKGAEVRVVNPGNEDFVSSNTKRMPLHILRDVNDDMQVMQDEIFGPVLPVKTYTSMDDVIGYVNDHPRPLGLYYFGEDDAERRSILDKTISGGVTLNDVIFHVGQEDLPFGGVGPAGMGAYHGIDGFKSFSHAKSVYKQTKIDIAALGGMIPPYGEKLQKTLKMQLKK